MTTPAMISSLTFFANDDWHDCTITVCGDSGVVIAAQGRDMPRVEFSVADFMKIAAFVQSVDGANMAALKRIAEGGY